MLLEKLFNHFEYVTYKRLDGIGIFDAGEPNVTFFYGKRETLFSDGEVITDNPATCELIVKNPTYCISAINYNPQICTDPKQITFEVFIANDKEETVEKASKRLRELAYEVNRRVKEQKRVQYQ